MNLTPASSSDLPSEAILTRVSESGTRLTHTAIFMGAENKPGDWLLATACGCGFLEVDTHADLHVTRRPRREPALHRRGGRGGILGESAERVNASVEQVAHRAAQLEVAPSERER